MENNKMWGYNAIYGEKKPEYHESFGRDMRDALNYLCARVRRSGDFWSALHTASAMYGVNYSDLRNNFEKRKKAGTASYTVPAAELFVKRRDQLFAETILQLTPAILPSSSASAAAVSCVASSTTLMMLTPREWYGMPMRPTMNWL